MKVKKAVITAAGLGTRFLPATKSIQKEMLPLLDKPILYYNVLECVKSGIDEIIIVTRYGNSYSVENFFDSNFELEYFLEQQGKYDLLKQIKEIYSMAHISYVRQNKNLPYGNASPLISAKHLLSNEPFAFMFGDDIVVSEKPAIGQLLNYFENNLNSSAVVSVQEVAKEIMPKLGEVIIKKGTRDEIESIIEKPKLEEVKSNLAEFGRFVFTPEIFEYLSVEKTGKGGELWLIDAVDRMAKEKIVRACNLIGHWYTTGDPLNYLIATLELAFKRDDLKDNLLQYLKKRLKQI